MTAILVGMVSAVLWGSAGLVNGRLARLAGALVTVAWSMLAGILVCTALALAVGWPSDAARGDWAWAAAATVGSLAGLILSYESYRRGRLGVVAPIVATQGAFAAVLAVAAGETLALAAVPALAAIVVGIAVTAATGPSGVGELQPGTRDGLLAPAIALLSALAFAFGLFATAQIGDDLHPFWVAWLPRAIGLLAITLPVAVAVGMRIERRAWPLAATGGVLEVGGLVAFVIAARDNAAVASVVSSQFAVVTALGAFVLWGERLRRPQVAGVVLVLAGVGALSVVQG